MSCPYRGNCGSCLYFGLNLYASSKFDIVDCLLVGYAKASGHFVQTFDSDLKKELAELVFVS